MLPAANPMMKTAILALIALAVLALVLSVQLTDQRLAMGDVTGSVLRVEKDWFGKIVINKRDESPLMTWCQKHQLKVEEKDVTMTYNDFFGSCFYYGSRPAFMKCVITKICSSRRKTTESYDNLFRTWRRLMS